MVIEPLLVPHAVALVKLWRKKTDGSRGGDGEEEEEEELDETVHDPAFE